MDGGLGSYVIGSISKFDWKGKDCGAVGWWLVAGGQFGRRALCRACVQGCFKDLVRGAIVRESEPEVQTRGEQATWRQRGRRSQVL